MVSWAFERALVWLMVARCFFTGFWLKSESNGVQRCAAINPNSWGFGTGDIGLRTNLLLDSHSTSDSLSYGPEYWYIDFSNLPDDPIACCVTLKLAAMLCMRHVGNMQWYVSTNNYGYRQRRGTAPYSKIGECVSFLSRTSRHRKMSCIQLKVDWWAQWIERGRRRIRKCINACHRRNSSPLD